MPHPRYAPSPRLLRILRRPLRRGLLGLAFAGACGLVSTFPITVRADDGRVFPDAESVEPLRVGSPIPDPQIRTIDGAVVDLTKQLGDRGALLVFYRGGW